MPLNAATTSNHTLLLIANSTPPTNISRPIRMTVLRRPNRSARNDQNTFIAADPASAAVKIAPISTVFSPSKLKYTARTTAR